MILLLIIADDFTGALDTGVQFAARGIRTRVTVAPDVDFAACEMDVLVVNTETRHLPAAKAYDIVAELTAGHSGQASATSIKRPIPRCAEISARSWPPF